MNSNVSVFSGVQNPLDVGFLSYCIARVEKSFFNIVNLYFKVIFMTLFLKRVISSVIPFSNFFGQVMGCPCNLI